ncbi:hypothetical protein TNCV_4962921 [Trichonephila clavipes]|nr:hypothetical protein TNCV_4962921 [Trichonephila clavipes]
MKKKGKSFIYVVLLSLVRSLIFSSRSPNYRALSATMHRGLDWLVGREGKLAWFFGGRRQRPSAVGLGNGLNGTSAHKLGTSPLAEPLHQQVQWLRFRFFKTKFGPGPR